MLQSSASYVHRLPHRATIADRLQTLLLDMCGSCHVQTAHWFGNVCKTKSLPWSPQVMSAAEMSAQRNLWRLLQWEFYSSHSHLLVQPVQQLNRWVKSTYCHNRFTPASSNKTQPFTQLFFNTNFPWSKKCKFVEIRNLSATFADCQRSQWQSMTENQLHVESLCQLSAVVSNSTHSESLVLHYG